MNTTGTVLIVHGSDTDGGGRDALDAEFDVTVADGALDAVKRLSAEPGRYACLVTETTVSELSLGDFLVHVDRISPSTAVVVVGEFTADADPSVLVDVDAYVPPGREDILPDRVGRLLAKRTIDRAVDRHERLARTVAAIAVDVAGAPTRSDVEAALHDHLAGGDWYRHVWIVGVDGGEELEVHLPVSGTIGEEELGDLVGGGDPAFVSNAIESGAIVSTEGRVPTRSAAARPATPSAASPDGTGGRSLASAAVPLVHAGDVWGVALLSTDRSDAFDGAERALLSDVGAIVGHALWALDATGSASDASEPVNAADRRRLDRGMETLVHELRNPLGIARSHLQIAREDDDPESLDRAESAIDRMVDTIDRVAEGTVGETRAETSPLELSAIAEAAWQSIQSRSSELEVVGSVTIDADRELLLRLLVNLFQNAVDHGGESATVRIGTLTGGFFVEDDGPGIPPDHRESVFDRGYSTSNDGLGIGLSIVRDVVDAHGWEISVSESSTGGARFEITSVDTVEDDAQ